MGEISNFWKIRIGTFVWGFLVSYWYTGQLGFASKMFLTMVAGNTIIMWIWAK
jgi:uncharacterized membrane protein YeaQ/YmgE (transglycosylase-associated protein family)